MVVLEKFTPIWIIIKKINLINHKYNKSNFLKHIIE